MKTSKIYANVPIEHLKILLQLVEWKIHDVLTMNLAESTLKSYYQDLVIIKIDLIKAISRKKF